MSPPLLETRGISKSYPGVRALREVNFSVGRGETVCLLGENGAGKSTLVKILAGAVPPDSGEILYEGREVRFRSTREASDQGISIVCQEFNLCPNLTVLENLFLGREIKGRCGLLSYAKMREKARQAFALLRTEMDPRLLVKDLGVAQQQMVEIAKALAHQTKLLILDEPTSALATQETENLFEILRELKAHGLSIVFISHRLKEVLAISDRVCCLRDGQNTGDIETKSADEGKLVAMMVGRDLSQLYARRQGKPTRELALEVRKLSRPPRVQDVSFSVRRGEILGLAGLVGAGRTELARLIMGADKKTAGAIELNGQPVSISNPSEAVGRRIGYLSEDRKRLGLVLSMGVRENVTMAIHPKILDRFGLISRRTENRLADQSIASLRIKVSSRDQVARQLSGGNQQKVALAKWLAIQPEVLILDEPTRGIDVGAKAEVHRLISELADRGVAILLISSELPEVLRLADRILVMREGRLTAELPRELATEEAIMKAAVA